MRRGGKTGSERRATAGDAPATGASDAACGWATLATGLAVSGFLLWRNRQPMDFSEYNLLNTAMILFVPLLVIILFLRREPSDFGMTPGNVKHGVPVALLLFAVFVPFLLFFAPMDGPQQYYLNWMGTDGGSGAIRGILWDGRHWSKGGSIDGARLAYHELVMAFYMFGWEWYYRGFLLFGLRRLMPLWGAILLQTLLFAALHWGKPIPELLSSIPGGVLMALFALRYRSFLPCFILHFLISAGNDAAVLYYHFHK